ncbi:DUF418 domain-containing protein [Sphingomonas sp. PB4P5]|uniref:DUF418 domain-containing protein n=1 Tax=Parasphingomonas puruogangriensis TaxID=3096155 RepID=UPI002FC7A6CE
MAITPAEPDGAPRIAILDILRGIAILGILFMNINDMGGSYWASSGDIRHFGWTMADQIAWWVREIFVSGTARCLLEMLFGVGMVILTDRAAAALGDRAVWRGYYRRNIVLFLFGLVHIFILLWPGDILHTYGLAALIAFLFRRLAAPALLGIGVLMALSQLFGLGMALDGAQRARIEVPRLEAQRAAGQALTPVETRTIARYTAAIAEQAKLKRNEQRRIAREDRNRAAATGNFTSWAGNAWTTMMVIWGRSDGIAAGDFLEPLFVWEAAATMLIGAALFKWGVIQGQRSRRFYLWLTVLGYAVGLPARAIGAYWTTRFDSYPHLIYATTELTRLATTLGHLGLINLIVASVGGAALLRPFAAAGRTALTLYVLQTIICLWILYPPFALGLYGKSGWAVLMLTALAIDIGLLWLANLWLRHFDIAPVEWAWRSIVERRRLPWRKRPKGGDNPLPTGIATA